MRVVLRLVQERQQLMHGSSRLVGHERVPLGPLDSQRRCSATFKRHSRTLAQATVKQGRSAEPIRARPHVSRSRQGLFDAGRDEESLVAIDT